MVRRAIRVLGDDAASVAALTGRFERIRADLGVPPDFPEPVVAAARGAAEEVTTGAVASGRADLRDLPFVTVDPPGSTDLDQAMA
jgi:exoribonuclease R